MNENIEILNIVTNITTIIANIITVIIFVWSFFWLNSYRKQKYFENNSSEARTALEELFVLTLVLERLFTGADFERHQTLKSDLPIAIKKLLFTLMLIKETKVIKQSKKCLNDILNLLLNSESLKILPVIVSKIGEMIKYNDDINELDMLESALLMIYRIENKNIE